tara:strand:+ start:42375 stop:42581 length:207 start_codon:yes stop_codon:yes gene_type:complete
MRTSIKKDKKANYKRKLMVRHALDQIEYMKKTAKENKESSEVIARKEANMVNFYKSKIKTFDNVRNNL